MVSSFSPGDVEIDEWILSGAGGGVDVSRRLIEFSIFENIKNPYTILNAKLMDVSDIINTGLTGGETVSLSFHQPGQKPYSGTFAVTQLSDSSKLDNQRVQLYDITGYSPHMNNLPIITKSFKNVTGTNAISTLVGQWGVAKPFKVGLEATNMLGTDKHPYIVPGLQIMHAIKAIMSRTQGDTSSAWVLFENQYNLILDTIEHLRSTATPEFTYIQRPLGSNFIQDQVTQQLTIIEYKEDTRYNVTNTIQSKNQTMQTFDRHTLQYLTKAVQGMGFGGGGGGGASMFRHFIPQNSNAPPTGAEKFMPQRKSMAGILDSQSITIMVALNTFLTVGLGCAVDILRPAGDTDSVALDNISGSGLMTELRHRVHLRGEKMQGTTTTKILKAGVE